MCPLFPLHLAALFVAALCPLWLASTALASAAAAATAPWGVEFSPDALPELQMGEQRTVSVRSMRALPPGKPPPIVQSDHDSVAAASPLYDLRQAPEGNWTASFNVTGQFIGYAKVSLLMPAEAAEAAAAAEDEGVTVTVVREKGRLLDTVFLASVITLVSVIYVNFGCALDWTLVRQMLRRPVGPAIGFAAQFVLMPLLSFGLGKLLFPGNAAMQLGMFFTGVSPAGGASNIWTVALGGNLNLSITMTALSTFAAFLMMPLWIFTLGRSIFEMGDIQVPYRSVATNAVGLLLPLAVGFLIQRFLPRASRFMVRILKPFSALLIAFIVVFAIVANFYLFQLFSWRIVLAGLGLPWLGFMFGWIAAFALKQPPNDALAIAVETGVQNTGIAIFLLSALGQPEADLTTVIPVSVAIMTPFPLMALFAYRKFRGLTGGPADDKQRQANDMDAIVAEAGDSVAVGNGSVTDHLTNGHVPKY